ncbi:Spo0E family sporulation regulatory protein-aspartic acid phosphatase [Serpentinicella sp. ANB-PHB4]|nr:Spo0E family sporulation regulatory protein-aspartic acid phosphatase [Serpentinicella sp. ANB-PHB4]MDR5658022.1 Spo0E family sporulation regulatory protein-aspartic acid phosphatase [Serpentinicella sp. ANB-PHB4]
MIKNDIQNMQRQLNEFIVNEVEYEKIYDLSVQLDELIINYYREEKLPV